MNICGLQKLSLLDYPGVVSCTLFTRGCDFLCPFCQNSGLVIPSKYDPIIPIEQILDFLKSRIGKLDGVTISGGEPCLQTDLIPFIKSIKDMGYLVKLDTNGNHPKILKELVENKLVDYVAIDIKNSLEKYPLTNGIKCFKTDNLIETISYLLTDPIDYEFRTTLVQEFHTLEDMIKIASLIKGANKYYLQNFVDSSNVIQKGLHPIDDKTLHLFKQKLCELGINALIRGEDL